MLRPKASCLALLVTLIWQPRLTHSQQIQDPVFDAVSIRPADSTRTVEVNGITATGPARWQPCEYLRDRVRCRMPLWGFIREAFQLREFEVTAPEWTKEDMFQLEAVMPVDTPRETARLMLKQAIITQFQLRYHASKRLTPVFALVPTQDGPKLTEPDPERPQMRSLDTPGGKVSYNFFEVPGHYFSAGGTLDIFASNLGSFAGLKRPVVNETGLTGKYVIDLTWKSRGDPEDNLRPVDPGILKAMEQQIGLKLEEKNEMREYLVIDHADRVPSEP